MSERLERLVNLTATLLDTRRPLSLDELAERLEPAYPVDKAARRRAFERDKETMRELGIPVSVENVDGLGGESGYRIHPEAYYLPELGLSSDELAALHVAVTAVQLEGGDARAGLRKLGGAEGAAAPQLAHLEVAASLPSCFDAVAHRRLLEFEYRGDVRRLEPYGVVHKFGHWYVVGRDLDRDAPRAFRVDRIDGEPVAGDPGAFEPPPGTDPARYVRDDPLSYGEEPPITATVLVAATRAALVVDQLGADAVVERRDDGSVVVALEVVNREAFRTWVLELLEHGEILTPVELRDEVVAWLTAQADAPVGARHEQPHGVGRRARLQRVLALVPWILEHPGVTLAELAERFEIDESELELDLELLPMCGLPPYTADRLIDVYVGDDGAVSMRLAEYFERPLRLTPAEGVALVAAGRALLAVPGSDGSGPLATALGKLEEAVGATGQIAVHVDAADHLDRLRDAAERGDQVEIDYYSSARDEMTTRVVDPIRVFHALGAWYLGAWCHRAEGERLFRIDRVRAVRPTGERVEPRERPAPDGDADLVYQPAPDDLRVRLRLAPEAAWVAESIPVEERIDRARGRVDVVLAVSGQAFLERLLLSLGPAAEVLGPPEAKAVRAAAARRVLARYDVEGRPQVNADDVGG